MMDLNLSCPNCGKGILIRKLFWRGYDSSKITKEDEKVVVSISEKTTKHGAIEGKTQTKGEKMLNEKSLILRFEKSGLPCLDVNAESMKEAEAMVNLIVYIIGKSPKSTGDYIEDVERTLNILKEEYNDSTK